MTDAASFADEHQQEGVTLPASSSRLLGLDAARGVAFLGMVVVNFHVVMSLTEREPSWLAATMNACAGRAAAMFVTLAGIGLTLLARSRQERASETRTRIGRLLRSLPLLGCVFASGLWIAAVAALAGAAGLGGAEQDLARFDPEILSSGAVAVGAALVTLAALLMNVGEYDSAGAVIGRRALFLLAIGYSWAPVFSADILHFYGVYLLLAIPLLRAPRWVIVAVGITAVFGAMIWQSDHEFWSSYHADLEYRDFWTLEGGVRSLLFNGWHPVLPWMAFLAGGLILGRLDLTRRRTAFAMLGIGALLATLTLVCGPFASDWLKGVAYARTAGDVTADRPLPPDGARVIDGQAPADLPTPQRTQVNVVVEETISSAERERLEPVASDLGAGFYDGHGGGVPLREIAVHIGPLVRGGVESAHVSFRLHFPVASTKAQRAYVRDMVVHRVALWMNGDVPHAVRRAFARTGAAFHPWPKDLDTVAVESFVPHTMADGGPPRWLPVETAWVDRDTVADASPRLENLTEQFLPGAPPHTLAYVLSAGSLAVAFIGLFLLLASLPSLRFWLHPLACTGRLALTLYLAHVLVFMGIFDALGLLRRQDLPMTLFAILTCWLGSVFFATLWCRFLKRGPLEWLMRVLTG